MLSYPVLFCSILPTLLYPTLPFSTLHNPTLPYATYPTLPHSTLTYSLRYPTVPTLPYLTAPYPFPRGHTLCKTWFRSGHNIPIRYSTGISCWCDDSQLRVVVSNDAINHQPSTINQQPSTLNHQASIINHQPPFMNHQTSIINHQEGRQVLGSRHQPSTIKHK